MGITAIVDDVVDAHMKNPSICARFLPYLEQLEKLGVIKRHTLNFFSAWSGALHATFEKHFYAVTLISLSFTFLEDLKWVNEL